MKVANPALLVATIAGVVLYITYARAQAAAARQATQSNAGDLFGPGTVQNSSSGVSSSGITTIPVTPNNLDQLQGTQS